MIDDNANIRCNGQTARGRYTRLPHRPEPDNTYYAEIRNRFLHDSARYLGADLTDSRVISLCLNRHAFAGQTTAGRGCQ